MAQIGSTFIIIETTILARMGLLFIDREEEDEDEEMRWDGISLSKLPDVVLVTFRACYFHLLDAS